MKTNKPAKLIKHKHIYDELCNNILKGVYKPGQKLPTENELAENFHASRPTIARAMRELQQRGLIVRQQGQGTFVRDATVEFNQTLGLLVHWQPRPEIYNTTDNSTIFGIMIPEMLRIAGQSDYSLLLNDIPKDVSDPIGRTKKICHRLIDSQIAGVFFTPLELIDNSDTINQEITAMFDDMGIAVVLLDRDIYDSYHRSKYDIIGINNEQSALVLTHHLLESGCRKIDFISHPFLTTSIHDRILGYRTAMEENKIPVKDDQIHLLDRDSLTAADNKTVARQLIHLVKDRQTEAFICVNDAMAADMINFFLRNEIRVPKDVRIVGFDDLPSNKSLPVPLTTVRQPAEALAYESIRNMLNRIERPEMPARDILVRTELIVRESCGCRL